MMQSATSISTAVFKTGPYKLSAECARYSLSEQIFQLKEIVHKTCSSDIQYLNVCRLAEWKKLI